MAIWQFAALFGGWCWLTLPHGFPHKRADRDPFEKGFRGLYVSTAFVSPRASRVRRNAVETGECPEWQRELTVNQPPHGFEGSSPSFPTIDKKSD